MSGLALCRAEVKGIGGALRPLLRPDSRSRPIPSKWGISPGDRAGARGRVEATLPFEAHRYLPGRQIEVKYTDLRIKSPRDLFDHVVAPSYGYFIEGDPMPTKIFSMASALFNVTGWIHSYHEDDVRTKLGTFITTAKRLWRHVEYLVPPWGVIRDLNRCGHHVHLDDDPNRQRITTPPGRHGVRREYLRHHYQRQRSSMPAGKI
jgi:hypothetical protein